MKTKLFKVYLLMVVMIGFQLFGQTERPGHISVKDSTNINYLIHCLKSKDHNIVNEAINYLISIGKPAVPELINMMQKYKKDESTKDAKDNKFAYAAFILGNIGKNAVEALPVLKAKTPEFFDIYTDSVEVVKNMPLPAYNIFSSAVPHYFINWEFHLVSAQVESDGLNGNDFIRCDKLCTISIGDWAIEKIQFELENDPVKKFQLAAKLDLHDIIQQLLKTSPDFINSIIDNECKYDLLHWTIRNYINKDIIELLIANGANINSKDFLGRTPLQICFLPLTTYESPYDLETTIQLIQMLIDKGADLNAKTDNGETILHPVFNAAFRTPILKHFAVKLIEMGASINAKNNSGKTPLDYALLIFPPDAPFIENMKKLGAIGGMK